MNGTERSKIGFALCAGLFGVLAGCVVHEERPRPARRDAPPPPVYVESPILARDDYLYYPAYEVYYSPNRRQYIYRNGRSWVSRPAPPRVSTDLFFASPSVRLDFHDSPAIHHATIVRKYPKDWAPPGRKPNHGEGNRDDGKGNDRGGK